ncbi:MAG: hypothetical protein AAF965_07640 [Pseudomonadota bacterium]
MGQPIRDIGEVLQHCFSIQKHRNGSVMRHPFSRDLMASEKLLTIPWPKTWPRAAGAVRSSFMVVPGATRNSRWISSASASIRADRRAMFRFKKTPSEEPLNSRTRFTK